MYNQIELTILESIYYYSIEKLPFLLLHGNASARLLSPLIYDVRQLLVDQAGYLPLSVCNHNP